MPCQWGGLEHSPRLQEVLPALLGAAETLHKGQVVVCLLTGLPGFSDAVMIAPHREAMFNALDEYAEEIILAGLSATTGTPSTGTRMTDAASKKKHYLEDATPQHSRSLCGLLDTPDARYKTCSGCQTTFYCGKDCQKAHWKAGHKAECKAIQAEAAASTK